MSCHSNGKGLNLTQLIKFLQFVRDNTYMNAIKNINNSKIHKIIYNIHKN